jgi:hypothetical protein
LVSELFCAALRSSGRRSSRQQHLHTIKRAHRAEAGDLRWR